MTEPTDTATDLVVSRTDLRECKFVTSDLPQVELAQGEALLRVSAFALTANNITYGVTGEMLRYWDFFPAPEGYGRIPVWGFGDVIRSSAEGVAEGQRFYGYYPMGSHLAVKPQGVSAQGFMDGSAHRSELPIIYNQYVATHSDPMYAADRESENMLFRPLFSTAFLLADMLESKDFYGAQQVILSSASSKTSMCLAQQLHSGGRGKVVGLTSNGNRAFVEGLGCYHTVLSYDEVDQLPVEPSVYVDMAGNGKVLTGVHRRVGENVVQSIKVGVTHWEQLDGVEDALPGAQPEFFFAPTQAVTRVGELGPEEFQKRLLQGWSRFLEVGSGWVTVQRATGTEEVQRVYKRMVDTGGLPVEGHILSL